MKIVFTGGGTAGHAMVNTILIPYLQEKECRITYIGSKNGMEKKLVSHLKHVSYYGISTGKLRRYLSFQNFTDLFQLLKGVFEALNILRKEKPQLVYSSGGYVTVPVVWAAFLLKIPVILRETDYSTGLANKLCIPFAKQLFATFPGSVKNTAVPHKSGGMFIRPELYDCHPEFKCSIDKSKPVCLVMGGSSGASSINQLIWENISLLTKKYSILHLCGKGKRNAGIPNTKSYQQLEYSDHMGVLYAAADVVITRSGSNAVLEGLLLGKNMVCIPLSGTVSRGEQMLNARFAEKNGSAVILTEEQCHIASLQHAVKTVLALNTKGKYKLTKDELVTQIKHHVDELYEFALKQLIKQMQSYGKNGTNLDFNNLFSWEIDLLDEVMAGFDC